MERINLHGHYPWKHYLEQISGNLYKLCLDPKAPPYIRYIGMEGEQKVGSNLSAIDPDGGPYIHLGMKIADKEVKSINFNGVIELE